MVVRERVVDRERFCLLQCRPAEARLHAGCLPLTFAERALAATPGGNGADAGLPPAVAPPAGKSGSAEGAAGKSGSTEGILHLGRSSMPPPNVELSIFPQSASWTTVSQDLQ